MNLLSWVDYVGDLDVFEETKRLFSRVGSRALRHEAAPPADAASSDDTIASLASALARGGDR